MPTCMAGRLDGDVADRDRSTQDHHGLNLSKMETWCNHISVTGLNRMVGSTTFERICVHRDEIHLKWTG